MADTSPIKTALKPIKQNLLLELRDQRRKSRDEDAKPPFEKLTVGQKVADQVAAAMGSWPFIIIQSILLFFWVVLNAAAFIQHWDPYPFILLNLALSFQAAYAAPFIMMSQNRQQEIDRKEAESDYKINIKAELEIELLHQKIDELREKEVQFLTKAISSLADLVNEKYTTPPA